jgi:hypothetical protein
LEPFRLGAGFLYSTSLKFEIMSQIEIDAELQIEIVGYSQEGVTLKLKLYRKRNEGFREDALRAMFYGEVLRGFDYNSLPPRFSNFTRRNQGKGGG